MIRTQKNNKGITLIALVITVIVLLILAGVAISMLSGENGILKQAARAKTETEEKSTIEQIKLAATAAMTNPEHKIKDLQAELDKQFGQGKATVTPIDGGDKVTVDGVTQIISESGSIRSETEIEKLKEAETKMPDNTTLTDTNGDKITVPKNFNIAKSSPTLVTQGMIIEDSEDNQYVWIPVFEDDKVGDWGVKYPDTLPAKTANDSEFTEEHYTAIQTALKEYTKDYKNDSCTDEWYGDSSYGQYGYYDGSKFVYYTNGNMDKPAYETLYHNMLKSVYKNGGFYIGRYEMGTAVVNSTEEAKTNTRTYVKEYTPSNATSGTTTNTAAAVKIGNKPVIKANAVPYNYITQSQAQMLAEELGKGADYSNVTSSLLFGVQWDAVCVFIEHYDTRNTQGSDWLKNNTYSKEWGNYKNSTYTMNGGFYNILPSSSSFSNIWNEKSANAKGTSDMWICTTGAVNKNSSLNIYDFAGNEYEWTLERSSNSGFPCVTRGGNFDYGGYASYRVSFSTCYSNYIYSARPSLFM